MLAEFARRGGVQTHERRGAVREMALGANPGAAIVPAKPDLAAARVCGVWDAVDGGEFCAGPHVARVLADVGVAAVVHDGVGVAAGEFLE